MRVSLLCAIGTIIILAPPGASSQPRAAEAVGKTCRGSFIVHNAAPGRQQGAFQIKFAGTPERPTAHVWRGFGAALATKVSDEVNSGNLSSDLTGFDDLGAAKDVAIRDSQVSLSTSHGAGIILIYNNTSPSIFDGTALVSTPTPGAPVGRLDWRSANTHILCR